MFWGFFLTLQSSVRFVLVLHHPQHFENAPGKNAQWAGIEPGTDVSRPFASVHGAPAQPLSHKTHICIFTLMCSKFLRNGTTASDIGETEICMCKENLDRFTCTLKKKTLKFKALIPGKKLICSFPVTVCINLWPICMYWCTTHWLPRKISIDAKHSKIMLIIVYCRKNPLTGKA